MLYVFYIELLELETTKREHMNYEVQIVFLVNGKPLLETYIQEATDKKNAFFLAIQKSSNAGERVLDAYITDAAVK